MIRGPEFCVWLIFLGFLAGSWFVGCTFGFFSDSRAILESKYIGLGKRVFSRITALLRHAMLFLEERRIDEIVPKKGEGG